MRNFLLVFLLFFSSLAIAQPPGRGNFGQGASTIKGKVTGKIVDAQQGDVLPFVSVVLKEVKSGKDVGGIMSGEDGSFKLSEVPLGDFELLVSFVGYERLSIPVELTPKNPDANLGLLKLVSTFTELDEVTVDGQRELIESRIDKMVYNAEQDVANVGGDAADVLRRTPMLNVDLDGNVSLRGNSNLQILINGKPSTMMASSPADALRVIPAEQIKSVEVITTPSAKYDGEGTAGIINIITKKKGPEGFSGNMDVSVGNLRNNGVLGINVGKGRFGFNASGSANYGWPRDGIRDFYREDRVGNELRTLSEYGIDRSDRLGFFGTMGAFYDFNAYHSVSSSFRLRGFRSTSDGAFENNFSDPVNSLLQQYERTTDNTSLFSGYEWSLDYTMKFPGQEGRELSFSYKIDGNVQDQLSQIGQFDLLGNDLSLFRDERNANDGINRENTLQIDYTHPVGKNFKIETGARAILREVTSDFEFKAFDVENEGFIIDPSRTDFFVYDQDVTAGYLSTNYNFGKKTGLVAGVRYEHTRIAGDFRDFETSFVNDYDNWLPSIILSRKLGKMTTLKASYIRRIQRPSLRYINPYVQFDNNRDITQGNPEIDPELTDQYELAYNTFVKKALINASVYYRRTTDVIESFLRVDGEGVSRTTYRNIGENNSVGINIFTSVTLFKIWTLRGGMDIFTYNAVGTVDGRSLTNDAILFSGNLNSNIQLPKDWVIDMFGFYRARRQTIQGFNPSFSIFSMGIRKQIWDKRASVGLRIVEPFFARKEFGSELRGPNFLQTSLRSIPFRSFGVNMSYKFGKLDFNQRQRRSKIKNDDLKQGGDDTNNF